MDTMYRKKAEEAKGAAARAKSKRKEKHASDDYNPKIRPRESHPDSVNTEDRISGNLNKLNRRLVARPTAALEAEGAGEDRGVRVVTRAAAVSAPVPLALIASCVVLAVVFMYMLSLTVQIEEYSSSIDSLQNRIAELKDETTQLEVQLENKYDLDEVERIATQEYGMVMSSSLQKKYISVSSENDVWEETEKEKEESAIEKFFSSFKAIFSDDKE